MALIVLSLCRFDIPVGIEAFVIGLSQISSFFLIIAIGLSQISSFFLIIAGGIQQSIIPLHLSNSSMKFHLMTFNFWNAIAMQMYRLTSISFSVLHLDFIDIASDYSASFKGMSSVIKNTYILLGFLWINFYDLF